MDYHGTDKDDVIDYTKLNLGDDVTIYGGKGNDTITVATGVGIGEEGNDHIIGTNRFSGAAYWNSPSAVYVDLSKGIAEDGFGGKDTLENIRILHGSAFDDTLIGSANDEEFYGGGGSNTIVGGGGNDSVVYYNVRSDQVSIAYDYASDTITVTKNLPGADRGVDTIRNVSSLIFSGPNSDARTIQRDYLRHPGDTGFFSYADWSIDKELRASFKAIGVPYLSLSNSVAADFSGDRIDDVVMAIAENVRPNGSARTSATPGRLIYLTGHADGTFSNSSNLLPDNGVLNAFVRKFRVGDFNADGRLDFLPVLNYEDGRAIPNAQLAFSPQAVYLSNGQKFDRIGLDLTAWGHGVAVGDVNGDGKADFFIGGIGSTAEALFIETGSAGKFNKVILPGNPATLSNELLDINHDGITDFLGTGTFFEVRFGKGNGEFGQPLIQELPYARKEWGVTGNGDPGYFNIVIENGKEFTDDGFHDSVIADIDQDGNSDFIGLRYGVEVKYVNGVINTAGVAGHMSIGIFKIGTNGKLTEKPTTFTGWDPASYIGGFQLVDINHDGHLDFFIQNINGTGQGTIFLNDGAGRFAKLDDSYLPKITNQAHGDLTYIPLIGDFNGDGRFDILIKPSDVSVQSLTDEVRLAALFTGSKDIYTGPAFSYTQAVPGFNEAYYLNEHPEIAKAVKDGIYSSGLEHYIRQGASLGYQSFAPNTEVYGSMQNDFIVLREGNEKAFGDAGDDTLQGGAGNDSLDGGDGIDVANYSALRKNYSLSRNGDSLTVADKTGSDGVDQLKNVEILHFSDMNVSLVIANQAKTLSTATVKNLEELYVAFFNRVPDAEGLSYWLLQSSSGKSIDSIANNFYSSAVQFSSLTGYSNTMSDGDFVRLIYKNVLGRNGNTAPPDADVNYWAQSLANGSRSKGQLVNTMLSAAHSYKGDSEWGWVANLLDNKAYVANYSAVQQGISYLSPETSITKGMQIAAAVTASDFTQAISLIGINDPGFQ